MITKEEIAEWRSKRGAGMNSAIGEYTPSEFWDVLDEIERLQKELEREIKNKKEFERDWLEACDKLSQAERQLALQKPVMEALAVAKNLLIEMRKLINERNVEFTGNLYGGIWTWFDRADEAIRNLDGGPK